MTPAVPAPFPAAASWYRVRDHAAHAAWDPLMVCLAVYLFTAVGRVHQLFPALGVVRPTLVASAMAIGLLVLDRSLARTVAPALRLPVVRCALGVLLWALLSIPGALWPGAAFDVAANGLLKTVAMFVVLICAVRTPADAERLGFVYFASVALYASVILGRFDVGAESWRLAGLYYYDANDFATLAVTALPLGIYFAVTGRRWAHRLVAAGGSTIILVTFVWAGSRGGFLALLAALLFMLVRFTAVAVRSRLLAIALGGVLLAATASDAFWTKMHTILSPAEDYNMSAEGGRVKLWGRGFTYMLTHPLTGVGAGNFSTAEGTISPLVESTPFGRGLKWAAPHNSFVQAGAELGVPGLLFFTAMIAAGFLALRSAEHRLRAARAPPSLAQALSASLLGFVTGASFLSLAYSDMLYMLLALAAGLAKTTWRGPRWR